MTGEKIFGILLIIFLVIVLAAPLLKRWLAPLFQRWMMHRMEDAMRKMMGVPTRKEEKRIRKEREKKASEARRREKASDPRPNAGYERRSAGRREPLIPKEYAVDVEFVEIREFDSETRQGRGEVKYEMECQVEDVKFVEIKNQDPVK